LKITHVETLHVAPRWLFVKVHTDEGLLGLGECLGDKARAVAGAVDELAGYLTGQDPFRIEHHWQAMYRGGFWRGGPILNAAISGVEIALWDLLGKALGVPIYQLLGGKCRDRVRMYPQIRGGSLEELAESAAAAVGQGFTAVKWSPLRATRAVDTPKMRHQAVEQLRVVREVVGAEVDILIDMHGRLSPAMAILLGERFAEYDPMFLEEPCLPENVDAMARIARTLRTPIATGERLLTKFGFREVLEKQAAAILQPDVTTCGGIMELKKIAAMAEAYYVAVAPHNPYGPLATAASLQVDACIPNFLIQEFVALGEGYLKKPIAVTDGYADIPDGPGLGVELDDEAIRDKPRQSWDIPVWFHADDGSVADW